MKCGGNMRNKSVLLPLFCALLCVFFWQASGSCAVAAMARQPVEPALSAVYAQSPALPSGAVTVHPDGQMKKTENLDDYEDYIAEANITDPLEPWNRFWFGFNNIFYLHVARPVYKAYSFVTPRQFRSGMKNFFSNLLFPVRFVNNILQFRFLEAGVEFGHFFVNTTSSFGLVDVAKNKKTIVPVDPGGEDFGQTLGRWGIGHGFYIVWPFIGPSSPRDSLGRIGDLFTDPFFYVYPWELAAGSEGALRFNELGDVLPLYEDMNSAAVDPYIAMRQAYVNFRNAQVRR
jgi:phospholipid-binding lipoprotein MlaA